MSRTEGTGIYRRGSVYWLNFQVAGVRHFVSLETDDYAEAVQRAREMRLNPTLNQPDTFNAEIEAFLSYKRRKNVERAHGSSPADSLSQH